ncbi:tetratricopeptide repeat protein [Polynucleobacter sp. JS-Polo-80-F4]|uniref:tetratricopeptide repeat protein n=1 Tax=Polynucleobacter sp. JS-Polo-80-F4 TaxID=2576918 RepID=UPI001C0C2CBD|nr:tetratricopeptide repeat protein [Polynucleobacter sp. JS-Polo-80-F4]MBU3615845.1 tetratricopeptide repeat protein [Polynucleobacter sp. JS-Polo-80-F4]
MTVNLTCPHCSSTNTSFKSKAQVWECNDCEERFPDTQTSLDSGFEPQTIFLSYAHKSEREEDFDLSEDLVWLIKAELERDGHQVWIDHEGIKSGTQWRERITTAILGHQHFLSFLSRRSVRDPGVCLNEIALAIQNNKVIQTILTESEESIRQPLTISHIQWHKFQDWRQIKDGKSAGPNGEGWDIWFAERMSEIKANLSNIQRVKTSGDLQRLKDILEPKTFEADIIKNVDGFYGRKWLFDSFDQWLEKSSNRLFWIKGGPGIGKSSFAAKLVHNANSAVVGFFKCEFQGAKSLEDSASECIRTLAYQLATRLPDYRQKLMYQQLIDKEKVGKKTADDLFAYLISEPLNTSGKIPEASRLVLIIDALDEAGRSDGSNALADLIQKNVDKLPSWLGLVVTSRPEPYLDIQLSAFEKTTIEGQARENIEDIKNYLSEFLEQKYSTDITPERRAHLVEAIAEKSGGTFLYIKRVQDSYDLTKPDELPSGIDDMFMRDFKRYFPSEQSYEENIEPYLRLLVASPGPLPVQMAQEILGCEKRFLSTKVMAPLGSLIQEKDGGTAFFHKSISDWLIDQKRSLIYCVNDLGKKRIGEFLWGEFQNQSSSKWGDQILHWLNTLVIETPVWQDHKKLEDLAIYYEKNLKYSTAYEIRNQQLHILEASAGKNEEFVRVLDKSALLLFAMGKYKECEELLGSALDLKKSISGLSGVEIAMSLMYLADIHYKKSEYEKGEGLYREGLAIYEASHAADSIEKANLLDRLAGLLNAKAENVESEDLIKKSLLIRETLLGKDHPDTAISYNRYAILLSDLERLEEAEKYYLPALEIFEKHYGRQHPNFARALNNYASLVSEEGRHEEAHALFKEAMDIRIKVLGRDHPDTAESYHNMANIHCLFDEYGTAEALYRKALEIRLSLLGDESYSTNNTMYRLANLLENMNRSEEAVALYEAIQSRKIFRMGPNDPVYSYDLH